LAEQLSSNLNISEDEVIKFEQQGILHPLRKNDHVYYSSADCYRAKALLHFMRDEGMSLESARERLKPGRPVTVPGTIGAELAQR
jgi:DNA-binding transcriptional MerR regulator